MDQNASQVLQELENLAIHAPDDVQQQQLNGKPGRNKMHRQTRSKKSKSPEIFDNEQAPALVEIRSTPDKGSGLFTTQKVPAGTRLFAEPPLISLEKSEENDPEAIESAFSKLSKKQQKQYLQLYDAEKSRMSEVVSIYYSNCYSTDGYKNDGQGGSCIGPLASRINHSCIPNVQFSYIEEYHIMVFHAIKAIPKGKEIFSNYDKTVFETSVKRRKKQQLYYGFICQCEACNPQNDFWRKSDERRRGMIEAKKTIRACENEYEENGNNLTPGADPTDALLQLEKLLIKEGLVAVTLVNVYKKLAKWQERKGNMQIAKEWKNKELEICLVCFGTEARKVRDLPQDSKT